MIDPTPSLAARVGESLYHRIVVSKGWTILGLVLAGLVEVANEQILPAMQAAPQPWLHILAGLIVTWGAAKISPAAVQAWAAKKQAEVDAPKGFAGTVLLGALAAGLALALLFVAFAPRPARADSSPAGPVGACLNASCTYTLQPGLSFGGTAYDFATKSVMRSYHLDGLAYVTAPPTWPVLRGFVLGASFQSGDNQGFGATEGLVFPLDFSLACSQMLVGSHVGVTLAVGKIIRF